MMTMMKMRQKIMKHKYFTSMKIQTNRLFYIQLNI